MAEEEHSQTAPPPRREPASAALTARTMPHSIEAEEYLLSCCLLDGADVLSRCLEARIRAESFYVAAHGLIYAAPDPKAGACGAPASPLTVLNHPALNHKVEVTSGLLAAECSALLTAFFRARR